MPLFGWMKWSKPEVDSPVQKHSEVPTKTLMRALLWHMEERERLVREMEKEQTGMDYNWLQSYQSLKSLLPSSERRQLEHLCSQIQPSHTATVLSRFREILLGNDILPWELVYVFKQVLKDFITKKEEEKQQIRLMESWTNRYQMKQGFNTPTVPDCSKTHKEEIPTISSYIDKSMQGECPYFVERIWDLPYYYPAHCTCLEAYSATI
ncbi:protein RD3-like [Acipenser ruthenus]|uniref:protein RD3-like n=1 Tax=Acipenser ruthenus TaxID=7906 RepID=UPI0027427D16|nr:protein RD3-like [Acipenser ruthenus]